MDVTVNSRWSSLHNRGGQLTAIGLLIACTACTNPKAVQTFAAMAPDPTLAQGLTQIYVAQPEWRSRLDRGTDGQPDRNAVLKPNLRVEQAKAIVAIDMGIRDYMTALGALAADSVVQSSSNVATLQAGLKSFGTALPSLGISDTDVMLIGKFIQAIADLAENGYRNAKLSELISANNDAFQSALDIQIEIVTRAILPSISEYKLTVDSKQQFMDSQTTTMRYLMDRSLSLDIDNASLQATAAQSYVKALGDIKVAHTALYKNRDNVLSKETFDQIRGPAEEAYQAFQAYQAAAASRTIR